MNACNTFVIQYTLNNSKLGMLDLLIEDDDNDSDIEDISMYVIFITNIIQCYILLII